MADLERVIMKAGYSALDEQAYAAEIYNTVVVDWDGEPDGRSVRAVGREFVELTVRGYIDPRTNGQRYAVYLNSEEESLSDFNSLKAAQAAYRAMAVDFAGDRETAWTATDVRAAQALQTKNGYKVGTDLSRHMVVRGQAAPGQESLFALEPEPAAAPTPAVQEDEQALFEEYMAEQAEAQAEGDADYNADDAEEQELQEQPEPDEPAADGPLIETSTGTYTLEQWEQVLNELGEDSAQYEGPDGPVEYDPNLYAMGPLNELRERTEAEIAARDALWEAIEAHGDDITHPDVIAAYDNEVAATVQAYGAAVDQAAEEAMATVFGESTEFLTELQQEAGASADQQAELAEAIETVRTIEVPPPPAAEAAARESLRAGEILAEAEQLAAAEQQAQADPAAAASSESLRAGAWLAEAEQLEVTEPGTEPTAALDELEAAAAQGAAPGTVQEQQSGEQLPALRAPSEVAQTGAREAEQLPTLRASNEAVQAGGSQTEQLNALRAAMGELFQALEEHESLTRSAPEQTALTGLRTSPEYAALTGLWSAGEQFWNQASELLSHYGQELREDIRMQGALRTVGTRLADGIRDASLRMSGWMIQNEAADHPVTRTLQRLAGAAQEWGDRLRGRDPRGTELAGAFEQFRGRDALSAKVAAEREQLTQTPQISHGGELAGGEHAADVADLMSAMFEGTPEERLNAALERINAAGADQDAKPERPKAAALATRGSGIEL
jgi:hypothetical protein